MAGIVATFAGIPAMQVSFTSSLGVLPSTGSITFSGRRYNLPRYGTLRMSCNQGSVTLERMYLVNPVYSEAEGGDITIATIMDRRVEWQYGQVTGKYNPVNEGTGAPAQTTKLTALLKMCFDEYDTRVRMYGIPNVYPSVEWHFDTPANVIQELCERYGLCVGLDMDGSAWVSPANESRRYPAGFVISRESAVSGEMLPRSVIVFGSRIRQDKEFTLYAVGKETDGTIKKIDDLSYAPADWMLEWAAGFENISDEEEKSLSEKYILKAWQVDYKSSDLERLPWSDTISKVIEKDGEKYRQSEVVTALYCKTERDEDNVIYKNTADYEPIPGGYTVYRDMGLIVANEPLLKAVPDGTSDKDALFEADVKVLAAYELNTGNFRDDFYWVEIRIPGGTLPSVYIQEPEVVVYKDVGGRWAEGYREAEEYLFKVAESKAAEYEIKDTGQRTYLGFKPLAAWGEIKSISWTASESTAQTVVSIGEEEIRPFVPSYYERLNQKKTSTLKWPAEATAKQKSSVVKDRPS